MILSFAWTTEAYLQCRKTVTRRLWTKRHFDSWVKAWREGRLIHQAWSKTPRVGGHPIGHIRLTCEPYEEKLVNMPESDLAEEGGPWDSLEGFWEQFPRGQDTIVAVVRFVPLPFQRLRG